MAGLKLKFKFVNVAIYMLLSDAVTSYYITIEILIQQTSAYKS